MFDNTSASSVCDSECTSSSINASSNASGEFHTGLYLEMVLGPVTQPPEKLIPLTIIYIGKRETDEEQNIGF